MSGTGPRESETASRVFDGVVDDLDALDESLLQLDEPLPFRLDGGAAATLTPAALDARLERLGVPTERRRQLDAILPWFVSVAVHLGLLAIGLAITWAVLRERPEEDPVLIVADFERPAFAPTAEALGPATERAAVQALPELPAPAVAEVAPSPEAPLPRSAPAAVDWSPRSELDATFAGLRASNARRVVYVVDASGSMVGTLPIIVEQLERSLRGLSPEQSYAVVFFQRNEALVAAPGERLVPAGREQIDRTLRWVRQRVVPAGRSNPLRALETALRMRPDAIFLLGNEITGSGEFEIPRDDLLRRLDRLNPADPEGRRRTAINCVQFLDPDPLDTLRMIADRHGGENGYRFLGRAELGVAPR